MRMYHLTHGPKAVDSACDGKVDPGAASRGIGAGTLIVRDKNAGAWVVSAGDAAIVKHVCE